MARLPYSNLKVQTLPEGGWEITGENPVKPEVKTPTAVTRVSAKIDVELVKLYKRLAAQQDRFVYELMEDALRAYLKNR